MVRRCWTTAWRKWIEDTTARDKTDLEYVKGLETTLNVE